MLALSTAVLGPTINYKVIFIGGFLETEAFVFLYGFNLFLITVFDVILAPLQVVFVELVE